MSLWRVGLLLLPQAWVAHAYGTFHAAATAAPTAAFQANHLGILIDSMVVIAAGWLTVAANLLIVVVLLRYAAKREVKAFCRRGKASARAGSNRPDRAKSRSARHRNRARSPGTAPVLTSPTPFDRVDPRPAEAG